MSLDPSENAAKQANARRDQAGTSEEDQSLDPPFPYRMILFDPTVFGTVADKEAAD